MNSGVGHKSVDFSSLDGKRIAVVLCIRNQQRVVCGTAQYVRPANKKNLLRIKLDANGTADGSPTLYILESEWTGSVTPDGQYGCDHQIGICVG